MNRREVLGATTLLAAATAATAAAAEAAPYDAILRHYDSFGSKRSGGPGDTACGIWMERELIRFGYRTERQAISVPFDEPSIATLAVGAVVIPVHPQPPFFATPAAGVSGRVVRWPSREPVTGVVAVVVLPFRRWSAFRAPEIDGPVRAALAAGAAAVVVVTTGPTGEIIALNTPPDAKPFPAPVVLIAPKAAAPLLRAADAGESVRLTVLGPSGVRSAFNGLGKLDRGHARWLVVSTPRSGWTTCTGERGPGVAVWLTLAAWATRALPAVNLAFVNTSAHEYDNAGGHSLLRSGLLPPPKDTALWVHLGANLATRDWHDLGPALQPLPSADPQRLLVCADAHLSAARRAFAGQPGLEAPYSTAQGADGELKEILATGYGNSLGVFGAHRFHHVATDGLQCVEPAHVAAAAESFKRLITDALAA